MKTHKQLFLVCLLLSSGAIASEPVYRCDIGGKTVFSQLPCDETSGQSVNERQRQVSIQLVQLEQTDREIARLNRLAHELRLERDDLLETELAPEVFVTRRNEVESELKAIELELAAWHKRRGHQVEGSINLLANTSSLN